MRPLSDLLSRDTVQNRASNGNAIWEARQDVRHDVTDRFETVDDPLEVGVDHRNGNMGPSRGFLELAEPREAAHRFDEAVPESDVGREDVEERGGGWGLTPAAERRVAEETGTEEPLEGQQPLFF